MEYNKDLEQAYEAAVEEPEEEEKAKFKVDNMQTAEWAAKQIAKRRARIEEIKAFADEKKARIEAWQESETKQLESAITYFETILRPFAAAELARIGGKKKSIKLSNGCQLKFTSVKNQLECKDENKLVEFLKANQYEDYVKVTEKAKWGDFKKLLIVTEDGDIVVKDDGIKVENIISVIPADEDKFSVDTKGFN